MNCKRGFRRIAFVFALAAAVICAFYSCLVIIAIRQKTIDDYNSIVEFRKETALAKLQKAKEQRALTLDERLEALVGPTEEEISALTFEKPEKGFWVRLSAKAVVGICTLAGLVGAAIGFSVVCLMYKLLKWLVLGFCGDTG
jgi:hypothetical protein